MPAGVVNIGCRLPFGIDLDDPTAPHDPKKRVHIKGLSQSETRIHIPEKLRKLTSPFDFEPAVVTQVTETFWRNWLQVHEKTFDPYLRGAFFVVKDEKEAITLAESMGKTGFEPLDPSKEFDIAGDGVVTADEVHSDV